MEVSKKEAARILNISPKEVVRRIESGELKGRKKTDSKFSDWVVTLPNEESEAETVGTWVKKEMEEKSESHPKEHEEDTEQVAIPENIEQVVVHKDVEPKDKITHRERIKEKEKKDGGKKRWWY